MVLIDAIKKKAYSAMSEMPFIMFIIFSRAVSFETAWHFKKPHEQICLRVHAIVCFPTKEFII